MNDLPRTYLEEVAKTAFAMLDIQPDNAVLQEGISSAGIMHRFLGREVDRSGLSRLENALLSTLEATPLDAWLAEWEKGQKVAEVATPEPAPTPSGKKSKLETVTEFLNPTGGSPLTGGD